VMCFAGRARIVFVAPQCPQAALFGCHAIVSVS
jgi:hypothetical protein